MISVCRRAPERSGVPARRPALPRCFGFVASLVYVPVWAFTRMLRGTITISDQGLVGARSCLPKGWRGTLAFVGTAWRLKSRVTVRQSRPVKQVRVGVRERSKKRCQ